MHKLACKSEKYTKKGLTESVHKAVNSSSDNDRLTLKVKELEHLPTAAGNALALLVDLEMTAVPDHQI